MTQFIDIIERAVHSVQAVAGLTVTWRRGADSVILTATRGTTNWKVANEYGVFNRIEKSSDFLVDGQLLKVAGTVVEPEQGDLIEYTIRGETHIYRATEFNEEPVYSRHGDTDDVFIHTTLYGGL